MAVADVVGEEGVGAFLEERGGKVGFGEAEMDEAFDGMKGEAAEAGEFGGAVEAAVDGDVPGVVVEGGGGGEEDEGVGGGHGGMIIGVRKKSDSGGILWPWKRT